MQFSIQIRFQEALAVGFVDGGEHHDGAGVDAVDDPPGVEDLHLGADTHQHLVGQASVGAAHVHHSDAAGNLIHDGFCDLLCLVADNQQHSAAAAAEHQLVDDGGRNKGHQNAVQNRVDVICALVAEDKTAGQNDRAIYKNRNGADREMGLQLPDGHNDEVRAAGRGAGQVDQCKTHAVQGAGKESGQQRIRGRFGIKAQRLNQIVRENGADHHTLDGFEEEHATKHQEAGQGYRNVDEQGDKTDAETGNVVVDNH